MDTYNNNIDYRFYNKNDNNNSSLLYENTENLNNYFNNINDDLDLRLESKKISNTHKNYLNEFHIINNNNNFYSSLYKTDYTNPINHNYILDHNILKGTKINYKSCNLKHKNYNNGTWNNYFDSNLNFDNSYYNIFNINTKKKTA
jgi:hypothetical protein